MNQVAASSTLLNIKDDDCFHCGEACKGEPILIEEKPFCCEGCKMVYTILQENDLCNYYDLNAVAGISQKNKSKLEYTFLDDSDTISKLIDFTDGEKTKVHFYLPQIHCSSCLWLLENLHRLNEGILYSRVDFLKKEVSITFSNDTISLRKIVELLDKIGYPPQINLNDLETDSKTKIDKSIYYKLGLAGFAFGNIMLLSFPEYLGLDAMTNRSLVHFLGYLNILLILPVIFYSGWDYLRSAWQGLKHKHLNIDVPISLGILALFFRSVFEILTHTGAGYLDSLAGLIFFLLIGKWFQKNTYAKLSFDRDYKSYFPIACSLKQGGKEFPVSLDKIKKGDTIVIRHGELIPADARLVDGTAKIDYSFVTGESDLVKKQLGDQLYAGGRQMGGLIEIVVSKKVSNSYLTQLWNEDTFNKSKEEGAVSALADKVAGFFTIIILSVAFVTLAYWLPKDTDIAINAFTSVLIIACPCAVALSIPFTFGNVVRIFSRQGIYLKNTGVLETLSKINHIVFDKTGTITNVQSGNITYSGDSLTVDEQQYVLSLVHHSTHPISQQIKAYFDHHAPLNVEDYKEEKGKGISGQVTGHKLRIGSNFFIQETTNTDASKQSVLIEIDNIVKGGFIYKGTYRTGLKNIFTRLKKWATISLLSGDNDREKVNLQPFFDNEQLLHFNKKPEDKLQYIKTLQSDNQYTAMIGDGLNDAGALSQSDVGIVITENTSNFTPACDIIMDASKFEKLPTLFSFSKISIKIVYAAYFIALIYNIIGLSYAVQGLLSPVIAAILMPLSSVTIVLFGVGVSTWLAYRKGILES
jgi:P-type Cu+ transporter